ncbi:WhiB family transcriptional regulator [Planobispora rosea]|uniref:WhiB family transcriptional regulator n=1 Tax=Planobispora rosea TaxID=35762 RepID=UPI00083B9C47|nr:WhiB family transcriptional regulator [Planobispora rosea]
MATTPLIRSWERPSYAWQNAAACKGRDLFFPIEWETPAEKDLREAAAKRICGGCPVRDACLSHAFNKPEKDGVWGGLTEEERGDGRRRHARTTPVSMAGAALIRQIEVRRRELGLTQRDASALLGRHDTTLSAWSTGKSSPLFASFVDYAALVGLRVILPHQGQIFAEGNAIIPALPLLRQVQGIEVPDLAERLRIGPRAVNDFERLDHPRYLSTVEAYVAGLGVRLELAPADVAVAS